MGKTSLALNIAENIGVDQELPVAVFSMEMGAEQLAQRLVSAVGRIDAQKLRKGQLDDDDWDNFTAAMHRLEDKPIFIDDTPGLTITELSSRARRLVIQAGPLGLIVVDYLQLMSGGGRASDNRSQELSEIPAASSRSPRSFRCSKDRKGRDSITEIASVCEIEPFFFVD